MFWSAAVDSHDDETAHGGGRREWQPLKYSFNFEQVSDESAVDRIWLRSYPAPSRGSTGLAGVSTRQPGCHTRVTPPAAARQLLLLT